MSAFVLAETGFEQLAQELVAHSKTEARSPVYYAVHGCLNSWDDDETAVAMKVMTFCKRLEVANYDAVNQRYREDAKPSDAPWFLPEGSYGVRWTPVQLMKNLQCLKYQMSEGDVPETEIFKQLEDLIGRIAVAIVQQTPEYDEAAWGW